MANMNRESFFKTNNLSVGVTAVDYFLAKFLTEIRFSFSHNNVMYAKVAKKIRYVMLSFMKRYVKFTLRYVSIDIVTLYFLRIC